MIRHRQTLMQSIDGLCALYQCVKYPFFPLFCLWWSLRHEGEGWMSSKLSPKHFLSEILPTVLRGFVLFCFLWQCWVCDLPGIPHFIFPSFCEVIFPQKESIPTIQGPRVGGNPPESCISQGRSRQYDCEFNRLYQEASGSSNPIHYLST